MSLICWLSVYLLPDLQGFPGSVREGFTVGKNSKQNLRNLILDGLFFPRLKLFASLLGSYQVLK